MRIDHDKLRQIRHRFGMTQAELGRLVGYSKEQICRMESKGGTFSIPRTLQVLLHVLDKSPTAYHYARQIAGFDHARHHAEVEE